MRVRGSASVSTRSMISPQRRFCSSEVTPAYSLKLDHGQPREIVAGHLHASPKQAHRRSRLHRFRL
jgi:hypothetical protein